MSDTEDAKPEESANEPITIRVKDQTGEETMFKIKKSTKMSKVFSAYAQRKGVEEKSLRFLLDGERILETATPKMLELEDEDQIDCVLAQVGGSGDDDDNDNVGDEGETKPAPAGSEEGAGGGGGGGGGGGSETITIRVKDQNGEETMFKIKKSTRMMKVFATYAARKGVEATAMRFMLDGDVRFFVSICCANL
jgi:small ubiquitin-related modifier